MHRKRRPAVNKKHISGFIHRHGGDTPFFILLLPNISLFAANHADVLNQSIISFLIFFKIMLLSVQYLNLGIVFFMGLKTSILL